MHCFGAPNKYTKYIDSNGHVILTCSQSLGPYIYHVHTEPGDIVKDFLKFVTCLLVLLFPSNRSIASFCR